MAWILFVTLGHFKPAVYSELPQPSYKECVRQAKMMIRANDRYVTYCVRKIQ